VWCRESTTEGNSDISLLCRGPGVLLLHGGSGATHEYLEACDSYLPAAGIEYYYYDQLGVRGPASVVLAGVHRQIA
jgi:hypothetical protein